MREEEAVAPEEEARNETATATEEDSLRSTPQAAVPGEEEHQRDTPEEEASKEAHEEESLEMVQQEESTIQQPQAGSEEEMAHEESQKEEGSINATEEEPQSEGVPSAVPPEEEPCEVDEALSAQEEDTPTEEEEAHEEPLSGGEANLVTAEEDADALSDEGEGAPAAPVAGAAPMEGLTPPGFSRTPEAPYEVARALLLTSSASDGEGPEEAAPGLEVLESDTEEYVPPPAPVVEPENRFAEIDRMLDLAMLEEAGISSDDAIDFSEAEEEADCQ